ncbi:MAG: radical SAM protein [Deltaproteobacteria bacterium]|nr:radical SAM protein [Deltaproteobacteria bacterium]MBN2673020.1 radical SAM protein [Deltaproteobacteria bacterium]
MQPVQPLCSEQQTEQRDSVTGEHSFCAQYLYQMPWSDEDNAMAWLEVTRECNLSCAYCCQRHAAGSTKSLDTIRKEINILMALRNCDTVIIAGGEPLLHPELEQVVAMVKAKGKKPVLLTNGVRLTDRRLADLVNAGLFGITFHVDSRQQRPGWEGCSELALNELREDLALLAERHKLHCGFNTVVFPDTLGEVQQLARWAEYHSDKVHLMMFIAVRTSSDDDPWEYYVDGRRISIGKTAYASDAHEQSLTSHDLSDQIRCVFPGYRFNSFLGGTANSGVLKWAMGNHVCRDGKRLGNLGPASVRLLQRAAKKLVGRYVSHISPKISRNAWVTFLFALVDKHVRRTLWKHVSTAVTKPLKLLRKLNLQTFIVMQPMDFLPTGGQDHCKGCPNMTVYQGQLVRGCELESYLSHGGPFITVPKRLPNAYTGDFYRTTLLPPDPYAEEFIDAEPLETDEITGY